MYLNLSDLPSSEIYHLLTQTVIPRPIAWILTENARPEHSQYDQYNLAPFSFFNAMASNPPAFVVSIGKKTETQEKDTRANLKEGHYCVVHIPQVGQMNKVSDSAATKDYGDSELDSINQTLIDFDAFPLPRLAESPIAFGCEVARIVEWGETPQAIILLEVKCAFIDEAIKSEDAKGRLKVDANKLNPLARLGANEYAAIGEALTLQRPK